LIIRCHPHGAVRDGDPICGPREVDPFDDPPPCIDPEQVALGFVGRPPGIRRIGDTPSSWATSER
jgi:hypothetical protein